MERVASVEEKPPASGTRSSDFIARRRLCAASVHNHDHDDAERAGISRTPAELTAGWLTDVLRASGAVGSSAVTDYTWCLVAEQGAAGIVGRASLTYDLSEPAAPASVVIKFASSHAPIRTLMHRFGLYRAEVEFYRQLSADAGIPTPRCYYADIDTQSGTSCWSEDMKDARPGDPLQSSIADVEVAIDHIAAFHARWWKHPKAPGVRVAHLPGGSRLRNLRRGVEDGIRRCCAVHQRLGSQLPPC